MTTPVTRTPGRALPDQKTLLAWVFAARALLAATTLFLATVAWAGHSERWTAVGAGVCLALLLTLYGYWSAWRRRRDVRDPFLFCQAVS